ncbi:MAG: BrnT family toxin [Adlercreutzia equolifaciens]
MRQRPPRTRPSTGSRSRRRHRVFSDSYARIIDDPDHSDYEERFIILGMSRRARMLTVCHCYRQDDSVIRIISARKATKTEERAYWRYCHES